MGLFIFTYLGLLVTKWPYIIPPNHTIWDAASAPESQLFLLLGLLFNLNSLPINFGYAWLAGWASQRVGAVQRTLHWLDRAAGALFIGFGLKLAMSDNPAQ
jgi:threonine/homoserine/homoserine lactone efflux protein